MKKLLPLLLFLTSASSFAASTSPPPVKLKLPPELKSFTSREVAITCSATLADSARMFIEQPTEDNEKFGEPPGTSEKLAYQSFFLHRMWRQKGNPVTDQDLADHSLMLLMLPESSAAAINSYCYYAGWEHVETLPLAEQKKGKKTAREQFTGFKEFIKATKGNVAP